MASTCETGAGVLILAAELVAAAVKLALYGQMHEGSLFGNVACILTFFTLSRFFIPEIGTGLPGVLDIYLWKIVFNAGDLFVSYLRKIEARFFIDGSIFDNFLISVPFLVVEPPPTLIFMIFVMRALSVAGVIIAKTSVMPITGSAIRSATKS